MYGDLTGRLPKDTYKDLLQISNNNQGVDSVLRPVKDGSGEDSALDVSTTQARVRGDLTVTGALNATVQIPFATDSVAGSVKIGAGINIADGVISVASGGATDAELRNRATHTGFQDISTITNLTDELNDRALVDHDHPSATSEVAGFLGVSDKAKLDAIEPNATANSPDEALRDRTSHTGFQAIDTITGLGAALDDKADIAHTHNPATTSVAGFLSAADKLKLDGLSGTGTYVLPPATVGALGGVKQGANVTIDGSGVISVAAPYEPELASDGQAGIVKPGIGLHVNEDGSLDVTAIPLDVPVATTGSPGIVKPGTNLTVDVDGTLNAAASPYTLPEATSSVRGGVRLGTGFTITETDKINVTPPSIPVATTSTLGLVKIGANLSVDVDGTLTGLLGSGGGAAATVLDITVAPYSVSMGTGKTQTVRRANLAAINSAMADAVTNGYIVYFPAGTVEIEAPTSGTSHILQASGTGDTTPVLAFGPRTTVKQFTSSVPVWKLTGVGGRVDGLNLTYNTNQTTGNTLYDATTSGALVLEGATSTTIDSVTITNAWVGVYSPGASVSDRNMIFNTKVVKPNNAGVYFANGYNNRFEGVTVTGDGALYASDYGFFLKDLVNTTIANLEVSWMKSKFPVGFSNATGTVINGLLARANQPMVVNSTDRFSGLFHFDALSTITLRGARFLDTNIDSVATTALKFKYFAHNAGSYLDVTDLQVSNTVNKNTSTQTVILIGPSIAAASANQSVVARMRQVTLDRRAGQYHRIDLLSDITPDSSHERKNVGLIEYNSIIGPSEGNCVDFGSVTAPIWLERHGSIIQVSAPLTAPADFTISNRTDNDYGGLTSPLLSRGATITVVRHPTATGAFSINLKGHDGTQLTALSTINQSAVLNFDGTAWRVQSKAMF